MSDTDQTVDTAECVRVVRALVEAFEAKGQPLTRVLFDTYAPESRLQPWAIEVSTELVERGMKALGMPTPEVPKPRKVPRMPSDAQARVLDYLNAYEDARLKSWTNWDGASCYHVMRPGADVYADASTVAGSTFDKLTAYKWVEYDREGEGGRRSASFYKLTDAGREVLTRHQVKIGAV